MTDQEKAAAEHQRRVETQRAAWDKSTPEGLARCEAQSERAKRMWSDDTLSTEERHQAQSERAKRQWGESTPEGRALRQAQSEHAKRRWDESTPEGRALRQAQSERIKRLWADGTLGTEEQRQAQSERLKRLWADGTLGTEKQRQAMSKRSKRMWESGVMDGVFVSPSSLEVAVAEALETLGVGYVEQFRPEGQGKIYDFLLPPSILIEVNGDYWHSLPGMATRDAAKAAWALSNGYRLIVLTESAIHACGALALVQEMVK